MYMPIMMKKLLYIDTKTVCINIFKVACFPMMVKNRRIITTYPEMEKYKIKLFFSVRNNSFPLFCLKQIIRYSG